MKKTNIQNKAKALLAAVLTIISFAANAQKLPNIQKDGVLAPLGVKTDGKATEWDDTFQAYNKSTDLYYTIANNADKLYLTVQATDPNIINKITAGGITFTIKSADKKSTVTPVAITYPVKAKVTPGARPGGPMGPGTVTTFTSGAGGGPDRIVVMGARVGGGAGRVASPMAKLRSDQPLTDSDLIALNKQITTNVKEIKVTGIKEFPDSTVSIYNDEGINAAGLINMKKAYTIEFAIALKYLQPVINSTGVFNYNVQLNGLSLNISGIQIMSGPPGGGGDAIRVMDVATVGGGGGGGSSFQSMTSPTDFSGTYTLVKK